MDYLGFQILYEQGPCLAVNKPSGLLTQAPPGIDSLELRIKNFILKRGHPYESVYLGIPHRLDRPASGAMVFCTKRRAARRLAEQFEERQVNKIYWACVEGQVAAESGTWEDYILKVPGKPQAEVVAAGLPQSRHGRVTLSSSRRWPLGILAGNPPGNRAHAPDPHPGRLPGPSPAGRRPIRIKNLLRHTIRRPPVACHSTTRPRFGIQTSHDKGNGFHHCSDR